MFDSIRSRVIIIALLIIGSIVALIPRNTTIRERDVNTGVMRDTTVRRVPLKLGLDLQGGMHLGLELDQSSRVSADPSRDLDLALTVLRKRIDEFGVTEPLIQKQGDDRIIVELAGVTDPTRAKAIVQRSAFLEFRITDRSEALDKALPALDRALGGRESNRLRVRRRSPARSLSCSREIPEPRRQPKSIPASSSVGCSAV
jgi:preprotein translocase subunit SecD